MASGMSLEAICMPLVHDHERTGCEGGAPKLAFHHLQSMMTLKSIKATRQSSSGHSSLIRSFVDARDSKVNFTAPVQSFTRKTSAVKLLLEYPGIATCLSLRVSQRCCAWMGDVKRSLMASGVSLEAIYMPLVHDHERTACE